MLQPGSQKRIKAPTSEYCRSTAFNRGTLNDTIDPRLSDEKATTGPIEDLVDLLVDDKEPSKVLKLGKNLSDKL